MMAAANQKLAVDMQTQPHEAFNIENVDESEPHIEMVRVMSYPSDNVQNLALGVLEPKKPLNEDTLVIPTGPTDDDDSSEEAEELVAVPLPGSAAHASHRRV